MKTNLSSFKENQVDLPERCLINVGVEIVIDQVKRSFLENAGT